MDIAVIEGYNFSFFNSESEFYSHLDKLRQKNKASLVFACDGRSLWVSRRNEALRNAYSDSSIMLADGRPLFWIGSSAKNIHLTGPKIFDLVLNDIRFQNRRHFFIGGPHKTLKLIGSYCAERGMRNVFTFCPPFGAIEEINIGDILSEINDAKPDYIWIGLGAPKQEIVAHILSKDLNHGVILGVGLAFDYLVDNVKKPPKIVSKIGLEWLWRYSQQPQKISRFILPFGATLILLFKFNVAKAKRFLGI